MSLHSLEPSEDIAFFIVEGMHRIATISMNDYGFVQSARMAQTYLDRASQVLESRLGFDKEFFTEIGVLKGTTWSIAQEYAQFENFCADCERFDTMRTDDWREWLAKCAVRAIARGYRGSVGHHLAYKIRLLHSRLSAALIER